MKISLPSALTFGASVFVGCAAAIAIASAAAVTHEAPSLRMAPVQQKVEQLQPVVVTISKARFDAIRKEMASESAVAANAGKVGRG